MKTAKHLLMTAVAKFFIRRFRAVAQKIIQAHPPVRNRIEIQLWPKSCSTSFVHKLLHLHGREDVLVMIN